MGATKSANITVSVDYHLQDGEGTEHTIEATVELTHAHPATYGLDGRQDGAENARTGNILSAAWLNQDGTMEREIPPQFIALRVQAAIIAKAFDMVSTVLEYEG